MALENADAMISWPWWVWRCLQVGVFRLGLELERRAFNPPQSIRFQPIIKGAFVQPSKSFQDLYPTTIEFPFASSLHYFGASKSSGHSNTTLGCHLRSILMSLA